MTVADDNEFLTAAVARASAAVVDVHESFVSTMRSLGADANAWVRWVNERALSGGSHDSYRSIAIEMASQGAPPPGGWVTSGYDYAHEDAREEWAFAWSWTREHRDQRAPLTDMDRRADACLDAREAGDPLARPLRRGHPRTRKPGFADALAYLPAEMRGRSGPEWHTPTIDEMLDET